MRRIRHHEAGIRYQCVAGGMPRLFEKDNANWQERKTEMNDKPVTDRIEHDVVSFIKAAAAVFIVALAVLLIMGGL